MHATLIFVRYKDDGESTDGYEDEDVDGEDQEKDALESASEHGPLISKKRKAGLRRAVGGRRRGSGSLHPSEIIASRLRHQVLRSAALRTTTEARMR